ncbi:family 20 glycosylhydrolase [Streptomyces sp. A7024]|uniref:beta-N-acetylhexosaminidase n=1 Tax=Streptomyces coryli TaxID=1128680 RepID=A0A6G4TW94_9ACTN|nr:family 20 glycosylhydrolase [Streptomyces coryli]NGN63790.1 family 20 glycosylhydrolase [Streptomyces coryli]
MPAVRLALAAGALLATAVIAPPAQAEPAASPAPVTVPAVRHWEAAAGTWELTPGSRIVVADRALTGVAEQLSGELADQEGVRPRIATGAAPRPHDIALALGGKAPGDSPEGYELRLADAARISAADRRGVLYGTRTLLQALRTAKTPHTVARGTIRDWPTQGSRGQMLDVGRRYFPVSYLKQQIRQLAWYKLNTFHLHLSDWNGYRVESAEHPEIVAAEHYTKAELRDLEAYAARYGITIVPEIDLPGHAVAIGDARPDLAFGCESMSRPNNSWEGSDRGHWTLDYTKQETRAFARDLVGEVADIFTDSPYVHIGTDEIPLTDAQNTCPELVAYQKRQGYPHPGDVLVEFINDLDAAVRAQGKTTQIWQWWDYQQTTSIDPDKRIVVNEWLSPPEERAKQGYPTIGTQDGQLYVSPGFGAKPGDYGFFDIRTTYRDYAFTAAPGILGYRVSRWSDRTQTLPLTWVDYFARRPVAVVADRTWATPAGSDVRPFLDRYDQVGDAGPVDVHAATGANPGMLSQDGWGASATSEESAAEPGQAARALDNAPYTHWHSAYGAKLPQQLSVDLGAGQRIAGVRYMPRQDGGINGRVKDYEILVSDDGKQWRKVAAGAFPEERTEHQVPFAATAARHVALRVLSEHGSSGTFASVAELDVIRAR